MPNGSHNRRPRRKRTGGVRSNELAGSDRVLTREVPDANRPENIFTETVEQVRYEMIAAMEFARNEGVSLEMHPVDVNVFFRKVDIDQTGFLFFNRGSEESSVELTLSTRVYPPDL